MKTDLFSHHKLALILGLIGAFIINFCRFPLGFSSIKDYPFHLLNILFSFILSLVFVLTKYVMIKFMIISPYLFIFYINIINSFIYILFQSVIIINVSDPLEKNRNLHENYFANNYLGIITTFKGQKYKFYIYFCLIFILSFFYYIISTLTIYNFNLYLIIIVDTCLPIDNDMVEIFYKEILFNKGKILTRVLFQSIGYIVINISALILNEIIILNFLGFNKNIRSNISSRSFLDAEGLSKGRKKNWW